MSEFQASPFVAVDYDTFKFTLTEQGCDTKAGAVAVQPNATTEADKSESAVLPLDFGLALPSYYGIICKSHCVRGPPCKM